MRIKSTDSTVRLIHDQMMMARVYTSLARMKNKLDLANKLQNQIKEANDLLKRQLLLPIFITENGQVELGAMNVVSLNPSGKATIHVENADEFKWLNSSDCPVLRQLESAAMKELLFQGDCGSSYHSSLAIVIGSESRL